MLNNDFNHYTSSESLIVIISVESKEEFEQMFPTIEVDCEKYIDEFKELFNFKGGI